MHWIVWYKDGSIITELDIHWNQVDKEKVQTLGLIRPHPLAPVSIDLNSGEMPIQRKHGVTYISLGNAHSKRSVCVAFEIGKLTEDGRKIYYSIDAITGDATLKEEQWQDS